jgi:hypothetical protein
MSLTSFQYVCLYLVFIKNCYSPPEVLKIQSFDYSGMQNYLQSFLRHHLKTHSTAVSNNYGPARSCLRVAARRARLKIMFWKEMLRVFNASKLSDLPIIGIKHLLIIE